MMGYVEFELSLGLMHSYAQGRVVGYISIILYIVDALYAYNMEHKFFPHNEFAAGASVMCCIILLLWYLQPLG